jgi:hypothetical protein
MPADSPEDLILMTAKQIIQKSLTGRGSNRRKVIRTTCALRTIGKILNPPKEKPEGPQTFGSCDPVT